jgi:hypothetical protein
MLCIADCVAENLYRMLEIEFLTVSCFVFIMFV